MKLTLIILCFASSTLWAQIPADWEGHYSGELHVEQLNGNAVAYHMELIVDGIDDSTYNWTIIYGEDSLKDERKYLLQQVGENEFVIDEKNGIVLSCNRIQNSLISAFEVQGSLIHIIYRFEKDVVYFDLTAANGRSETGNTENVAEPNQNDIPLVYTYKTTTIQNAVLKNVK